MLGGRALNIMHRVVRHTGEVKKDMDAEQAGGLARVGADGTPVEHRTFGIETRVLVATGLLGLMAYAVFKHDPVPRKPRLKDDARAAGFDGLSSGKRDHGYARRQIEDQIEKEVDEAEEEIDDEFEHTDLDEDELDVSDDEDEGDDGDEG